MHLDGVHHQASCQHAQAREQNGHHDLARDRKDGLREDPMGGPSELTAEALQLLALEAKLLIQLGHHHDQAADHIHRSKTSTCVLCLPPAPRYVSEEVHKGNATSALSCWRYPQMPLS